MAQGKKIKIILKLQISAGEATPAPPIGPALGQHGVNIMEFVKSYNEETVDKKGQVVPAVVTVYEDRSFSFITKTPPVSEMIKKELRLEKGSGVPHREKVGKLSTEQLRRIAETKLPDLNTKNIDSAIKVVAGTARSMGVEIEN